MKLQVDQNVAGEDGGENHLYRFTTEDISSRGWTANTGILLSCWINNIPNLNGPSSCGCGYLEGSEIQ